MGGFNGSAFGNLVPIKLPRSSAVTFFASPLFFPNVKVIAGKWVANLAMRLSFSKFSRFLNGRHVVGKFFSRKNFFNGEAPCNSTDKSAPRNAQFFAPLSEDFCDPVIGQKSIVSLIFGLFLSGSPAAILRRIRPVVVNSVDTHSFGWVAHVGKKVLKGLPAFANFYASGSVIFKRLMSWIVAPSFHMIPDGIRFRGRGSVSSFHVFNLSKNKGFA